MNVYWRLSIFAITSLAAVILFSLAIRRGRRKFKFKTSAMLLYVVAVGMIGVVGEIFVDSIYNRLFGTPLWRYNFLPVHHAYTSEYAPILWGTFGLYLFLTHHSYDKWTPKDRYKLAAIFGLEALMIEAIADLVSRGILGNYIFYYYPNGLWHISAFQNFPFYFLCGVLIIETVHWFKYSPHYFILLSSWVMFVTVYLS